MTEEQKTEILSMLTDKRRRHTEGVRSMAAELSDIYGADKEKADIAVCFHDLFRGRQTGELDSLIEKYGVPEKYKGNANLSHGKIAAEAMRVDFGIGDEDILNAVSFHTTGRAGMSTLEKIVFLSDAIEPGRDYPGVNEIRLAAKEDLDRACLMSLEGTIRFLREQGEDHIDEDTLKARDHLVKNLKKSEP